MKFHLEVELDELSGEPLADLGRILRYWAANVKHYPLEPGAGETIWPPDSASPVGRWTISG